MRDKLVEVIKKAALEKADYFGLVYQREGFFEHIAAAIREQMCVREHEYAPGKKVCLNCGSFNLVCGKEKK